MASLRRQLLADLLSLALDVADSKGKASVLGYLKDAVLRAAASEIKLLRGFAPSMI